MTRLEEKQTSPGLRRAIEAGILVIGVCIALTIRIGIYSSAVVI